LRLLSNNVTVENPPRIFSTGGILEEF